MLRAATTATAAVALALVAGCGATTDEGGDEPRASYRVVVSEASFPPRQQLAEHVELRIAVRNVSRRTIPNVAATLATGGSEASDAFGARSDEPGLSSRSRPVWIVDEGPRGGDTAYTNTWTLGAIGPGRTRTFTWRVVPVRAGRYELRYRLFGSTTGRSGLRLANGALPEGSFTVRVSGKPPRARITPDGRIVNVPPR
jgi:hypothetical protein